MDVAPFASHQAAAAAALAPSRPCKTSPRNRTFFDEATSSHLGRFGGGAGARPSPPSLGPTAGGGTLSPASVRAVSRDHGPSEPSPPVIPGGPPPRGASAAGARGRAPRVDAGAGGGGVRASSRRSRPRDVASSSKFGGGGGGALRFGAGDFGLGGSAADR